MAALLALGAFANIYGLDGPFDNEARRALKLRKDPPDTFLDKSCVLKEQARIASELHRKISKKFDFDRSWAYTEPQDGPIACVLDRLPASVAERTYFFAYLAAGEAELLQHWLEHYNQLGIRMDRARIILDTNAAVDPAPTRQGACLARSTRPLSCPCMIYLCGLLL